MRKFPFLFAALFLMLPLSTAFAAPKFTNPFSTDFCKSYAPALFAGEWADAEKSKFCANINALATELNGLPDSANKSRILAAWNAWFDGKGQIGKMSYFEKQEIKQSVSGKVLGTTTFYVADHLQAKVWIKDSLLGDRKGQAVFLHETQHFADGLQAYSNRSTISSYELERRGHEIESLYAEIAVNPVSFFMRPSFWEDSWRKLPASVREEKRQKVIYDWLAKSPFYPNSRPMNHQMFNFDVLSGGGVLQTNVALNNHGKTTYFLDGRPLVEDVVLEKTKWDGVITWDAMTNPLKAKSSAQPAFEVVKAADASDPQGLWQAAVQNEGKLYREMADYLYQQKVFIQCVNKEEKPIAEYVRVSQMNRKQDGSVYEKIMQFPEEMPCVRIEAADLFDYTTLYWVIPNLAGRDAHFTAWDTIDGIEAAKFNIAQLSVNDTKDIGKRTDNRYFYGDVWVGKADGQIIRLNGHTKPDDGMHKYPHLRADRKRTLAGIWLPFQVGGREDITGASGYVWRVNLLVQYENYLRFESDVKILDEEEIASNP